MDDRFGRLGRAFDDACRAALDAAADTAVRSAKRRTPHDTGELRDSIGRTALVRSGDNWEVAVTADAPHALFVEFGTVDTPTQPFLRPAARAAMRTTFRRELKRRLPRR